MTRGGRTFCFSHPPGLSLWPQQPPLAHCCRRKPTLASACAVGRRASTALSSPTATGGVAAPGQGGCSGWKAEGGRAQTGTGSCPGSRMLSCTCSHWVSPPPLLSPGLMSNPVHQSGSTWSYVSLATLPFSWFPRLGTPCGQVCLSCVLAVP